MKTNIILIMTDDQTVNTINECGNSQIITPNLDRLCQQGMTFTNCHICGGTSGAVSMPSRAVTHTSKNLFALEDAGWSIPDDHPLLGETLRNAGYQTFFTGKWHNGPEAFKRSFTSGDNIFFGGMWDHYNVPMNKFDPSGKYDNYVKTVVNFFNSNETLTMRGNKFNPGVHSTDVVTTSALNFLDSYDDEAPFFLNMAYLAPHDPRVVPQKYLDMYSDAQLDLPNNYCDKHLFLYGQENERDEKIAPKPLNEQWCLGELKSYYAMITHLDDEIGRVLNKLDECGMTEETLVIFTSDNGLSLSAHGLMGKQSLYDEALRVPMIIRGPGIAPATKNENFVLLQDIFPTIVEYLGIDSPKLDGISFAKSLVQEAPETREVLYLAFTNLIRGVKTKDYKLIKYRPTQGVEINQLFNLKTDPLEKHDLYNDHRFQAIRMELELCLIELMNQYECYENKFTEEFWRKYE